MFSQEIGRLLGHKFEGLERKAEGVGEQVTCGFQVLTEKQLVTAPNKSRMVPMAP